MFTDYRTVYTGDIFASSQCIWHENTMMDWLRSQLTHLGFVSRSASNKNWRRNSQDVICCLVDDITTCSDSHDSAVPRLWSQSTQVITDNHICCPTWYKVHQLPPSWFGIYAHTPHTLEWQPDRRFNFSVTRLDIKRMILFLEHRRRLPWQPNRDAMDYVSFNCWSWDGDNSSDQGLANNFTRQWQLLDEHQREIYQETFDRGLPTMPFRNHDLDHDLSLHRAWINLVVETYSGDSVIALSEKTFRALVTPVPWMLYSGRHTVAYLESLGFDCLSDIVNHDYDQMIETRTVDFGDKIVDWFWIAQENYDRLRSGNLSELQSRCNQAAEHNRARLFKYRLEWPRDLADWWPRVLHHLDQGCD